MRPPGGQAGVGRGEVPSAWSCLPHPAAGSGPGPVCLCGWLAAEQSAREQKGPHGRGRAKRWSRARGTKFPRRLRALSSRSAQPGCLTGPPGPVSRLNRPPQGPFDRHGRWEIMEALLVGRPDAQRVGPPQPPPAARVPSPSGGTWPLSGRPPQQLTLSAQHPLAPGSCSRALSFRVTSVQQGERLHEPLLKTERPGSDAGRRRRGKAGITVGLPAAATCQSPALPGGPCSLAPHCRVLAVGDCRGLALACGPAWCALWAGAAALG